MLDSRADNVPMTTPMVAIAPIRTHIDELHVHDLTIDARAALFVRVLVYRTVLDSRHMPCSDGFDLDNTCTGTELLRLKSDKEKRDRTGD